MNIGFIGLGKLGLPVAVAMASKGHDVLGHDADPARMNKDSKPGIEAGPHGVGSFDDELAKSTIRFGAMAEVAAHAEIVFIAVQTPHGPEYEGITPLPESRADFDYTYLKAVVAELAKLIERDTLIAIVSTVLPGTCRRELLPLCNNHMRLVYNPSFIAMGTTMFDFFNPEIVLCGAGNGDDHDAMERFYKTIVPRAHFFACSLETAELIKVAYNTFIGQKIVFANAMMEICQRIPEADCDDVSRAMALSTRRLISPAYLKGGMGDGGACHPRDNIAMSWLARKLGLGFDLFGGLMEGRERQAEWIAERMIEYADPLPWADRLDYTAAGPLVIVGYAYKPGTDLTTGSAALLVADILKKRGYPVIKIDPRCDGGTVEAALAAIEGPPPVILIGCNHPEYVDVEWPLGSIVIDPWRYIADQEGVTVLRLGEGGQ